MSHSQNRFIIGLTGPLGSGVTFVSQSLEGKGSFQRVSVSDGIKRELLKQLKNERRAFAKLHLEDLNEKIVPDFRKRLQDIGNAGRKQDPAFWIKKAIASCTNENVPLVIDGIRNCREIQYLREEYPQFFLVAVHVESAEVRWRRLQDYYDGDKKKFNRDNDRDQDEDEENGQQVGKCVLHADYVLLNHDDQASSAERFTSIWSKLEKDIELMRDVEQPKPKSYARLPTYEEVHMATAYAQSHLSRCLKRHVGALVVDINNLPISLGYNENPIGMPPCLNEFGHCFKDADMHKKLESMHKAHCRDCGKEVDKIKQPWRCPKCDVNFKNAFFPSRNLELCTAIHAEERAIRSLYGRSAENGTMYATTFPCFQCSRYIVDAKIKRVVYVEAYPVVEAAEFLKRNGVEVVPFSGFKARAFNRVFKQVD